MTYPVDAFDYTYPPELIAQHPVKNRESCRLLRLDRETRAIYHQTFRDFPALLNTGDVLVLNASRVIPARLQGTRENGRPAEVLLVHAARDGTWLAMVHPGGKLKVGRTVTFGPDAAITVAEVVGGGLRRITLEGALDWPGLMEKYGTVPLPPYIERKPAFSDVADYQTVYAKVDGSVAAPTAGLHFTQAILQEILAAGVAIAEVVLHIGPGTFKPVQVEDVRDHRMHAEWFEVSDNTAQTINAARAAGGKIWAVGTTAARVLESSCQNGQVASGTGWTDLFIRPLYAFGCVDALLTNFHLPRSTLLMLVAAFGGYEPTIAAYREAVDRGYRLYSYGDAMVIL